MSDMRVRSGKRGLAEQSETSCRRIALCRGGSLTLRAGLATVPAGVGKLGVTKRADGSTQVTANGKPLCTFSRGLTAVQPSTDPRPG